MPTRRICNGIKDYLILIGVNPTHKNAKLLASTRAVAELSRQLGINNINWLESFLLSGMTIQQIETIIENCGRNRKLFLKRRIKKLMYDVE